MHMRKCINNHSSTQSPTVPAEDHLLAQELCDDDKATELATAVGCRELALTAQVACKLVV